MERFTKAEEIYNKDYANGEYCHEQSFLWGFQEGFELAKSNSGKELLYVAQKNCRKNKERTQDKST